MKVAFINSGILGHRSVMRLFELCFSSEGGLESSFLDLSQGLTPYDRVIRKLLCLHPARVLGSSLNNWDLARWRHELHSGLIAARRLAEVEKGKGRFDVLHFHPQPTAYLSLSRMKRTPSIVSVDCTSYQACDEAQTLNRPTYLPNLFHDRLVFRAAAAIVCTSHWARSSLVKHYPECEEKIQVIPYPVRLEGFEKSGAKDPARVHALFIGGDFVRKGGEELLEAWREGGFGELHRLTLVTDHALDLSSLPKGVVVVSRVTPYGAEWYALWRDADFFVMPSRHEAFGMVFQEAAAAGLPVLATAINAIPEIVGDGKTGLLVRKGNRKEMVEGLGKLLGNAGLRKELGMAARHRAETEFAPAIYREKIVRLIHTLAKAKAIKV